MAVQTEYPKEELETALRRAFADKNADFIVVDGNDLRSKFLWESLQYGLDNNWLKRGKDIDEDDILGKGMGQYLANTYRLSDEGKKHFGVN